jgi:hypothetical protein
LTTRDPRQLDPLLVVLLGFGVAFLAFFLGPVFLSSKEVMRFPHYVPAQSPIGVDLQQMLSYSGSLVAGRTPYIGSNLYPPLAAVLFAPLLLLRFETAYAFVTVFTVLAYVLSVLVLPALLSRERRVTPVVMLVFATGLFSYGLQFELERGQFNVLAMTACLCGLYAWHRHPKRRAVAYVLFSLGVQLKLYPAIFVLGLAEEGSALRANLRRFAALLAGNLLCFLCLGPWRFVEFVSAVGQQLEHPTVWVANHSLRSFAVQLSPVHATAVELGLLALFATAFGCVLLLHEGGRGGLEPHLLLSCSVATLVLPAVSHDYKLAILAPATALFLDARCTRPEVPRLRPLVAALLGLLSLAYFSTTFSFTNKATLPLRNALPALLVLQLAVLGLSAERRPKKDLAAPGRSQY